MKVLDKSFDCLVHTFSHLWSALCLPEIVQARFEPPRVAEPCRLPPVMWLVLKKPKMNDINFWASWICIILGVSVTVLGAVGALRAIIVDASSKL